MEKHNGTKWALNFHLLVSAFELIYTYVLSMSSLKVEYFPNNTWSKFQ